MKKVIVYTTVPCARCGNAKAILDRYGAEYEEVNLAKDPDGRAQLVQRTGLMTFPQIVVGGRTLGGLDDLRAADERGELAELLAA
ncbi:MAG: glutaredoxin [Actinomycetota bacterium]|nr:glutaredoxin [Actinomycetota bacterium]